MVLVKFLGILYLDMKPANPGSFRSGEQISIGNTVAGKEIPFLPWGKGLVATLPLCNNISWNELNEMGFATGQVIKIDGRYFLCRLLRIGQRPGDSNEWNDILSVYGNLGTTYWHPELQFWGQEASPGEVGWHLVRGVQSVYLITGWGISPSLLFVLFGKFTQRKAGEILSFNVRSDIETSLATAPALLRGVLCFR